MRRRINWKAMAVSLALALGISLGGVTTPAQASVAGISGYMHAMRCNLDVQVFDWLIVNETTQAADIVMYVNGVASPEETAYPAGTNNSGTTEITPALATDSVYTFEMKVNGVSFYTFTGRVPLCGAFGAVQSFVGTPYCSDAGLLVADWFFVNNVNSSRTFNVKNNDAELLDPTATYGAYGPYGDSFPYSGTVPVAGAVGDTYSLTAWIDGAQDGPAVTGSVTACTPKLPTIDSVTITGTARVGSQLTAVVVTSNATTVMIQWTRDGVDVPKAVDPVYNVLAADNGHVLAYRVTASNGTNDVFATSAGVKVVIGPALVVKAKPTLKSYIAKVGVTLKIKSLGRFYPAATSYKLQWYKAFPKKGAKLVYLKGATRSYLKVTKSLKGYRLVLRVVAYRAGYKSGVAYTAATTIVK